MDEPEIEQKKLELLEGLVDLEDKRIIINTSIDPLFFLTSKSHDFWQEKGERQIPLARWATVLQKFAKLRGGATEDEYVELNNEFMEELIKREFKGSLRSVRNGLIKKFAELRVGATEKEFARQWAEFVRTHIHEAFDKLPVCARKSFISTFARLTRNAKENEFSRIWREFLEKLLSKAYQDFPKDIPNSLVAEGWPNRLLRDYAKKLLVRKELQEFTAEDVVDQMRDLADAHYRKIWSSCSTDEKILLFRLAQEGYINWRMEDSLRSLIRRRIVVVDPNFRFMNESFRQFVLRAEHPEVFQEWEDAAVMSLWSRIRIPIIFAGIILAVFLFATQKELFGQTLKVLTALTVAVPALIKIIGSLQSSRNTPASQE